MCHVRIVRSEDKSILPFTILVFNVYDVVDRVSLNRRGISCPSCYFVIENIDLNVFLLYY